MHRSSARFRGFLVLAVVATVAQLPGVGGAADAGAIVTVEHWTIPLRPSLVKCGSDLGRSADRSSTRTGVR
jgi:hypothetical protein